MGRKHVFSPNAQMVGAAVAVGFSPRALLASGCNMQVEVATASAFVADPTNPTPRKSILVMAHLDTGASKTQISPHIAQHLGLTSTGVATANTANGPATNPTYAVDLTFVGTALDPKVDLNVGSCPLPFSLATHAVDPTLQQNFGVLLGRDVMAAWHIMWDGPTSTVMIYE